jgi:hypothetical protein
LDTASNIESGFGGLSGEVWERAKAEKNWLLFRLQTEVRDGKEKLAKKPTLDGERTVDRGIAAVRTFDEASAFMAAQNMLSGAKAGQSGSLILGYFPRPGAAMYGLDFDNCVDPRTGKLTDDVVASIVAGGESYAEISPSGKGLRIWIAAPSDERATKRRVVHRDGCAGMETSGFGGNAFTFTGKRFPGAPASIGAAPLALNAVLSAATDATPATVAEGRVAWDGPLEEVDVGVVKSKLRKALETDQTLSRRWAGTLDGMLDTTGSAVDLAIIGRLKKLGFSFSEVVHCMLSEYDGESPAATRWRGGNERDMRRDFGRAGGATAEEEFEPVHLQTPGSTDWIEHDERAFADLEEFWRVDGVIPFEGIGEFYGAPGCGKTFLALDLGLSVATGRPWMGRPVEQCPVVYVASEGGRRAARNRIVAWQVETGVSDTSLFECAAANFSLPDGAAPLLEAIAARGVTPKLVIIDTLNQNFGGADENSAQDMGRFVAHVKKIQRALGGFVLVLHHSGKDDSRGARGHSSLLGALDLEAKIEGGSASGAHRTFKVTKSREGMSGQTIAFRLKRVVLGRSTKGKEVTTCVALPIGSQDAETRAVNEARQKSMAGRSAQQARALALLERRESLVQEFEADRWTFDQWLSAYIEDICKSPELGLKVPSRSNAGVTLRGLIEKGTPAARYFDGGQVAPIYFPFGEALSGSLSSDESADD